MARRSKYDSLVKHLNEGQVNSRTTGEILQAVCLEETHPSYMNAETRTRYRTNLIITEKLVHTFRDLALKVQGELPKIRQGTQKDTPISSKANIFSKIQEDIVSRENKKLLKHLKTADAEDLESFLSTYGDSSELTSGVRGHYTFFEPHEQVYFESHREKSNERLFGKVSYHLAVLRGLNEGLINPSDYGFKDVHEAMRHFRDKSKIEDAYGMRIIFYNDSEVMNFLKNFTHIITNEECSFRECSQRKRNLDTRLRFWENEDEIRKRFYQKKDSGYSGWHLLIEKDPNPKSRLIDVDRFELQLFTIAQYLKNETDEKINHVRYERERKEKIDNLPEKVKRYYEEGISRLNSFIRLEPYI
jgi:hypothetical protein